MGARRGRRPGGRGEPPATSTSPSLGEKLRGRFALVRRGARVADEWLLIKKHDDDAVAGWDPEDHPRSVKSGRTNDEVREAPAGELDGLGELGRADRRRAGRPRRARHGRAVDARRARAAPHRPRQGHLPGPRPWQAADEARPHPPPRHDGAGDAAVPRRPAGRRPAVPARRRRARDVAPALPKRAPSWLASLAPTTAAPSTSCPTRPPRWPGWPTTAPSSSTRGPRRWTRPTTRRGSASTSGPGRDVLARARLHRAALEHLGVEGRPVATARWHPDLRAGLPPLHLRAGPAMA